MPSRCQERRHAVRLSLGCRTQAVADREGGAVMSLHAVANEASAAQSADVRIAQYDWEKLSSELSSNGCTVAEKLLSPKECRQLAAMYAEEEHFRSHVHMARHGFGKGEYRYFKYPLPELLADLRTALYPHLAAIAN